MYALGIEIKHPSLNYSHFTDLRTKEKKKENSNHFFVSLSPNAETCIAEAQSLKFLDLNLSEQENSQ